MIKTDSRFKANSNLRLLLLANLRAVVSHHFGRGDHQVILDPFTLEPHQIALYWRS
jgi:hypothetical protein